jgi:hypothetical protein
MAVVGSWARGDAGSASDVDVVALVRDQEIYVEGNPLADVPGFGKATVTAARRWGPLIERRFRLADGLEVDLGFAALDWACTAPVDAGTARVARDGLLPLHDPDALLRDLLTVIA